MDRTNARWLIGIGIAITLLLLTVVLLLLTDDNEPAAVTTLATTTTVTTTTTTQPATTTTEIDHFLASPEGLGELMMGMSPEQAIATGSIIYAGPDFTSEQDGYECGFGESIGVYGPDAFSAMFMEEGLVRLYITDDRVHTAEGVAVGRTEADMAALMGPPTESGPNHYVAEITEHYYRFGDHGIMFTVEESVVTRIDVGFWVQLHLVEGCL